MSIWGWSWLLRINNEIEIERCLKKSWWKTLERVHFMSKITHTLYGNMQDSESKGHIQSKTACSEHKFFLAHIVFQSKQFF